MEKKLGAETAKIGNAEETKIINGDFKDHEDSLNMSFIEREIEENRLREHYIEQPLQEHALETFDVARSAICIAGDNSDVLEAKS